MLGARGQLLERGSLVRAKDCPSEERGSEGASLEHKTRDSVQGASVVWGTKVNLVGVWEGLPLPAGCLASKRSSEVEGGYLVAPPDRRSSVGVWVEGRACSGDNRRVKPAGVYLLAVGVCSTSPGLGHNSVDWALRVRYGCCGVCIYQQEFSRPEILTDIVCSLQLRMSK